MADSNYNPADNLSQEDRSKGGKMSSGSFGEENSADPSRAGAEGGSNSSSGGNSNQ